MKKSKTSHISIYIKFLLDFSITLLIWIYYTLGFIIFFSFFYMIAVGFSENREIAFQRLNHRFCRSFFFLIRILTPLHKWDIHGEVAAIRSSVIVCNHISYLDPLLLISLFERQKTIVKGSFFKLPIFSQVLKSSGYIPSTSGRNFSKLIIQHIETMGDYLARGGNLFIFPEGTRTRDGRIGQLNKGAFKIARICKAPIKVLRIRNTNILLQPGHFLLNTCVQNTMTVELIKSIEPDYQNRNFSVSGLMDQVSKLLESGNMDTEFHR